jgi:hypothetical protein
MQLDVLGSHEIDCKIAPSDAGNTHHLRWMKSLWQRVGKWEMLKVLNGESRL